MNFLTSVYGSIKTNVKNHDIKRSAILLITVGLTITKLFLLKVQVIYQFTILIFGKIIMYGIILKTYFK